MELQHTLDFDAHATPTWQEEEVAEAIERDDYLATPILERKQPRIVRMQVSPSQYDKAVSPGQSFAHCYIRYHSLGTDHTGQRYVMDMERKHIKFLLEVRPTKHPRRVYERDPFKRWS